jgi:uncharacterized membrane protein YesL
MKIGFLPSLRVIGRSFVDWWDSWLDMVLVCIVWTLAQVTVILGPPATFGMYYVAYRLLNGESLGVRGLIEGGRKYFGKAWLWGLMNLAVMVVLVINVQFYSNVAAAWGLYLLIFILMLGFLWFCTQFYALPYFMEQDGKSLKVALRNGLLTTMAAPFFTLILMLVVGVVLVASFTVVLPLFLGLPGLIPVLGFRGMYDRLVAFKLREPEKTPKEIEAEQSSRIVVPDFDHLRAGDSSTGGSAASSAPGGEVADSKGQVEQKE